MSSAGQLHHLELYVASLQDSMRFWEPLLGRFGYERFQQWDQGVSYRLGETYIVFVQTEREYLEPGYHRKRVGLNHLAFHAESREQIDEVTLWARENGHPVLYEDRHPHAGGPDSYSLYCEDPDRIKVEIVAPDR